MAVMKISPDDPTGNFTNRKIIENEIDKRGINTQSVGEITHRAGRNEDGEIVSVPVQYPLFTLEPTERDEITKQNSYIFGIVSGRMNRISGIDWKVTPKKEKEDDFIQALKMRMQIFKEYSGSDMISHKLVAFKQLQEIMQRLPDVLPDLSNFDASLRRWRKRYLSTVKESSAQVEDWIQEANSEDDFEEFQKKWIYDLMVHGADAIYWDTKTQPNFQTFYMLPGGTVLPIRNPYAGPGAGWVQIVPGYETKVYFKDEIIFDRYMPVSSRSYGMVPLDALVNKVTESLLFDKQSAQRADGTKPPEKAVVFGQVSPFGGFGETKQFDVPLPKETQNRLEQKFNTERQNAIAVISGVGTPHILDLSRSDTFAAQNERQTRLLKDIALVFNVSNNEINETGSEGSSGRSTSESLERVDKEKGIGPLIRIIDKTMTKNILPRRFGDYWEFKHDSGMSEVEQVEIETKKINSGTYDVNEIREKRGDDPYDDEQFSKPQGSQQQQLGSELNPMNMRAL